MSLNEFDKTQFTLEIQILNFRHHSLGILKNHSYLRNHSYDRTPDDSVPIHKRVARIQRKSWSYSAASNPNFKTIPNFRTFRQLTGNLLRTSKAIEGDSRRRNKLWKMKMLLCIEHYVVYYIYVQSVTCAHTQRTPLTRQLCSKKQSAKLRKMSEDVFWFVLDDVWMMICVIYVRWATLALAGSQTAVERVLASWAFVIPFDLWFFSSCELHSVKGFSERNALYKRFKSWFGTPHCGIHREDSKLCGRSVRFARPTRSSVRLLESKLSTRKGLWNSLLMCLAILSGRILFSPPFPIY